MQTTTLSINSLYQRCRCVHGGNGVPESANASLHWAYVRSNWHSSHRCWRGQELCRIQCFGRDANFVDHAAECLVAVRLPIADSHAGPRSDERAEGADL